MVTAPSCEHARRGSPGQGGAGLQLAAAWEPLPRAPEKAPKCEGRGKHPAEGTEVSITPGSAARVPDKELSGGWKGQPAGTRAGATLLGKQTPPQPPQPAWHLVSCAWKLRFPDTV